MVDKLQRAVSRVAKAVQVRFARTWHAWSMWLGPGQINYASEVDVAKSSIVVGVINWIARTFPEAPIQIEQRNEERQWDAVDDHPMAELLERPNPFYSGVLLWRATIRDWILNGNAYWLKVRSGAGRPVQLWWLPSWTVEPAWPDDGMTFISHYEYKPEPTVTIRIEVSDIVHFRYDMDSENIRKGASPVASLLRELFSDQEAAGFSAAILKNLGVPGVIISPENSEDHFGDDKAVEAMKTNFQQKFGGDRRGEPMINSVPMKVQVLSFSPEQMNLRELRRIPEERVTAVLGVPAVVVGLGAGLDRSTFSNMAEARESAYESGIIPMHRLFSSDLRTQLLSDFADTRRQRVSFDYSQVRVLQEDQNALWQRYNMAVQGGWCKVSVAKQAVGLESDPGDDVYLRQVSVMEVGPEADQTTIPSGRDDDDEPTNIADAA